MASIQLEALKKKFSEHKLIAGNTAKRNPDEVACLGFNVTELDVAFSKSQGQLSAYYKPVPAPAKAVCEEFLRQVSVAPSVIKK